MAWRIATTVVGCLCASLLAAAPGAAAAPVSARVLVAGQHDVLAAGSVRVRVRSTRGGRVPVLVRIEDGGRGLSLARPRPVLLRRGVARTVEVSFSPSARRRLERCGPQRLVVLVGAGAGRRRVASRALEVQPPRCGRFFGPRSVWNTPLPDDAPRDPADAEITGRLVREVERASTSTAQPTINSSRFSTPVHTVPRDAPTVRVALDKPDGHAPALRAQFAAVPLPAGARPAPGSDGHLVVWQPATDTMWEFWRLREAEGGWVASWGGRLDGVTTGPGYFDGPSAGFGATATGLPLAGGLMTLEELRAGRIDHALALALPGLRGGVAARPAQRSDGGASEADAVPAGARFRLSPALDLDALELPPVVLAMARAAQRYGIVVRDGSANVTFYGEDPAPTGTDPYGELFGGRRPQELLRAFPWRALELVRMDLRAVPRPTRECALLVCP